MNPSEEANYLIALNASNGLGFVEWSASQNLYVSDSENRSTQILYFYIIKSGIDFDLFVIFLLLLFFLSYCWGIILLFRISRMLLPRRVAKMCALTWALYPSNFLHIGTAFLYENLAISTLMFLTLSLMKNRNLKISIKGILFVSLMLALIGTIRVQMFIVALIAIGIMFVCARRWIFQTNALLIGMFSLILFLVLSIPGIMKNHEDFGEYSLGYQGQFMFWEGANENARGSWDGSGRNLSLAKKDIENVDNMSEAQLGDELFDLSRDWIKNNPQKYFILQLRKMAIFFYPTNFESGYFAYSKVNPFTLFLHFFFLLCISLIIVIYSFAKLQRLRERLRLSNDMLLCIVSPIVGSLLLTMIFFVGYRWRFYAEPYMLVFVFWFYYSLIFKRKISTLG
jgi:hypothetical protein